MNISNAQDMYTSLSDRLFNRKEKKLCHPNQFTLLNRLCLHFGSLQMPLFRSRFLSMFYNRGAVDKFGKRLTKTNCHYPILVNVFKFALKECSLSVSLWSFNGLLGLGVLLPNSLWHVAILAMLPVQKIFEEWRGKKKHRNHISCMGQMGWSFQNRLNFTPS